MTLTKLEEFFHRFARVDNRLLATFLDQFGMMLQCGITPGRALDALAENQTNRKLEEVIENINLLVHQGHSLTGAMARHPDVFPSTIITLIRVGDQGGDLARQLRRSADMLDRSNRFVGKIRQAVTGPLVTAGFCGLILFMIVKTVFPKFLSMYEAMNMKFPAISKAVFVVVNFVNHPLTLVAVIALVLTAAFARDALFQKIFNVLLVTPGTRELVGKLLCATTCETLATLHRDGVPLHRTLSLIAENVPYSVHRAKLEHCKKVLVTTGSLHEALSSIEYFPDFFHAMVAIGEETGALDELLTSCQTMLEQEVEVVVDRVSHALEPAVTCLMGVAMGVLFVGMFLPIYGLLNNLGNL